jgi:hypothetical protein
MVLYCLSVYSSIDKHPDRDAIDAELVAGIGFRTIQARHSNPPISLGTLSRYWALRRREMGLALRERSDGERAEHASDLVNQVVEVTEEAKTIVAEAKTAKSFQAATMALNTVLKSLEFIARLTGELQSPNAGGLHLTLNRVTTTVYNAGSDQELAELVSEATDNFSEATIAHLKRLAVSATTGQTQTTEKQDSNSAIERALNISDPYKQ